MDISTTASPSDSMKSLPGEISLDNLPTEIFFVLFEFVAPKDMIRCRQVCTRWRDVIDAILTDETLWEKFCRRDYPKVYKQAMQKTPNITSWFEIYRSLSLWPQLPHAKETIDEFCHSNTINEEMRNVVVQEKGLIHIHKRIRVVYHDLMTLEVASRKGFTGQYISLIELIDHVIMLSLNGDLHIVKKPHNDWHSDLTLNTNADDEVVFTNVKTFIVENRIVFYSILHHEVFEYNLDHKQASHRILLPDHMLNGIPDAIAAIGYNNGHLNIITLSQNLYTYANKEITLKFKLDGNINLMDCMYQHNMLENIDWRHYYMLVSNLKLKRHTGHLQFVNKMQIYGDELFFVGTQSGIVNIYFKPFLDGKLNLAEFAPIKSYNFSSRIDIPILSVYPIINLEVIETKEGHIILVCMPRKILVITYTHDFKNQVSASKAVIPYVASPESI